MNWTPEQHLENDQKIKEICDKANTRAKELMKRHLKFGFSQYYTDCDYFPIIEIAFSTYSGDREFRIALLGLCIYLTYEPNWK